jgi:hypothetical protein
MHKLNQRLSPKSVMLPEIPSGEHELMIPYRPWRAAKLVRNLPKNIGHKRFEAAFIGSGVLLGVLLLAAYIVVYFCATPFLMFEHLKGLIYQILFLAIASCGFVFLYPWITAPTNIQLGRNGIRFHWLHDLGLLSTPWIPWEAVQYVSSTVIKRGPYQSESLDFNISLRSLSVELRRSLYITYPTFWSGRPRHNTLRFRLDKNAIPHDTDLNDIFAALAAFLQPELIDASVPQLDRVLPNLSFTRFWLEDFSNSGKDDGCLEPLKVGRSLANGRYTRRMVYLASSTPLNWHCKCVLFWSTSTRLSHL